MQVLDPHGRIFACWDFADDDANAIGRFHPRLESFAPAIQRWRGRIDEMLVGDCLSCPYVLLHGTGCQSAAFNREGEFWVRDCQDFPEEFELAVQGAVGDLRVRGRTPKYESAAAEQERRASEREARIPAPTSLPHAE